MWKTSLNPINSEVLLYHKMWKNIFSTFTVNLHCGNMVSYTHNLGVSLMSNKYSQSDFPQFQPIKQTLLSTIEAQAIFDPMIIQTFLKDRMIIADMNQSQTIIVASDSVTSSILIEQKDPIESIIQQLTDTTTQLSIYTPSEYEHFLSMRNPNPSNTMVQTTASSDTFKLGLPLPAEYTFENFVVGDCNRECHAAALACAYNPGRFYNPLFIYGNSGLGKTHLLCSVGNYVLANDPTKRVCYLPTMDFVEAVSESIRKGTIDAFKEQLRTYDVLLMDDIQFLANKEKSHEIFFNCYNELINNHKQIIVVSDRLPNEIKGIEDRLISRFRQGLTVGIDSPEFETSVAILKKKLNQSSSEFSTDIDDESIAFLATNFNSDVRALEGSLKRLQFCIIQANPQTPVDVDFTMSCFKGQPLIMDASGINPKKIITTVADYYNLTRQQITSKTRTKEVTKARQIAMYLIRKLMDLPYLSIGAEFGGKDHSTVMSSISKVEKLIKSDGAYAMAINELEKQLKPKG